MGQLVHFETPKANGFSLQPKDIGEAMQIATMISSSQLAPKNFQGKAEDTLVAMLMGSEIGLNPMQALQNIAVINGRPSIWGDALLALVQNHPAFESIEETYDEATQTAICTVVRKGGKPHASKFSKTDADLAGLWGRNTWKQYPKRMLAMRARGFALRNQFADALLGLITREEAQDMPTEEHEINPVNNEPEAIVYYSQSDFDINFPKWKGFIESGKGDATVLIGKIETKGQLTEDQKKKINDLKVLEQS